MRNGRAPVGHQRPGNSPNIAWATCETIGRASALLYFVVQLSLELPLPLASWPECAVCADSIPPPGGAAVRSATRSSRAISQVACATAAGTVTPAA